MVNDLIWVKNSITWGKKLEEPHNVHRKQQWKQTSLLSSKGVPPPPSPFEKFQIGIQKSLNHIYQRLPYSFLKNMRLHLLLSLLDSSELALEIVAENLENVLSKRHPNLITRNLKNWTIATIEILKYVPYLSDTKLTCRAFIRLILLKRNGGKILVQQGMPHRASYVNDGDLQSIIDESAQPTIYNQPVSLSQVYEAKSGSKPTQTVLTTIISEILWVIRPVIYGT